MPSKQYSFGPLYPQTKFNAWTNREILLAFEQFKTDSGYVQELHHRLNIIESKRK